MLKFNESLEQICYIALPKDKAEQAIKNHTILLDQILYEYMDNLHCKENDIILGVVVDLSHMFDFTNKKDFDSIIHIDDLVQFMKSKNKKILRYVDMELSVKYKIYHIKYRILDHSVIRKVSKTEI